MHPFTVIEADVSEEEAAATLAAITLLLAQEGQSATQPVAQTSRWHNGALLVTQGLTPTRLPVAPRWGTIERLRRANRGRSGIVGM